MRNMPTTAKKSGFTLLEILVTVALFSILALMLFSIVQSATVLWRENERRVDSYREARSALNVISSDLRNIFTKIDAGDDEKTLPMVFAINSEPSNPGTPTASAVESLPPAVKAGTSSVFFFSALPSRSQASGENLSDVCQVGYYLAFTNDGASSSTAQPFGSYKLFRYLRSSTPTFVNALKPWFENTAFVNLFTGIGPSISANGSINEELAFYITDFQARPMSFQGANLVETTPRMAGRLQGAFEPELIELTITATNSDLGRRLQSKADWDAAPTLGDYRQNSRVFSTRIPLNKNIKPLP